MHDNFLVWVLFLFNENKGSVILPLIKTRGMLFCVGSEELEECYSALYQNKGSVILRWVRAILRGIRTMEGLFCVVSEQEEYHFALDQNNGSVILRWIRKRGVSFCVVSEQGKCHSTLYQNKGSVILRWIRVILRGIRTRGVSFCVDQSHSAWDQNRLFTGSVR